MKNFKVTLTGPQNLWKESGPSGVTWFASAIETDRNKFLCYLCLLGFVIFELEIKKKLLKGSASE